jgi:hypothetical protein
MITTKQHAAIMRLIHPPRRLKMREQLFVVDQCKLIAAAIQSGASRRCVNIMLCMVRERVK